MPLTEARFGNCPPPGADGMSVPRSDRGELHTAFTQSSIVPVSRPAGLLVLVDSVGDEHPANTAMAKMAATPRTLFICTAPLVRRATSRAAVRTGGGHERCPWLTGFQY